MQLEPEHPLKESEAENLANLKESEAYFRATGNEFGLCSVCDTKIFSAENSEVAECDVVEYQNLVRHTSIEGMADFHWGNYFEAKDELSKSRSHYERCVVWARRNRWKLGMVLALTSLGRIALKTGDIDQARVYYEEALVPGLEIGMKLIVPSIIITLTRISLNKGEYSQAVSYLQKNFSLVQELVLIDFVNCYLITLVDAAERMVQPASTPRLLGFIKKVLLISVGAAPITQEIYEQILISVKSRCDPETFPVEFEAGECMTREQVVAEARLLMEEISQCYPVNPRQN